MAGRKRRGKGEGSIYRRGDGRWVGQYEVNGKRRYVSGKTRAEVTKKLTKAIAERSESTPVIHYPELRPEKGEAYELIAFDLRHPGASTSGCARKQRSGAPAPTSSHRRNLPFVA